MRLIDPVSGKMMLKMRPIHLDRLDGATLADSLRVVAGVPFRLKSVPAIEMDVSAQTSLNQFLQEAQVPVMSSVEDPNFVLAAVAETSVGWSLPRFWFRNDHLVGVQLSLYGQGGDHVLLQVYDELCTHLGEATKQPSDTARLSWLRCLFGQKALALWQFPWGDVSILRIAPDYNIAVSTSWQH